MADPRLLQSFTASGPGPGQVQNTTADPFLRQGISAQPSVIETLLKKFFGGSGSDPGIGPMALEAPAAGIVLNPRNVQIIKDSLTQAVKDFPQLADSVLATKYMELKHPLLSGLSDVQPTAAPRGQFLSKLLGQY